MDDKEKRILSYFEILTKKVKDKISTFMCDHTASEIASLIETCIEKTVKFQDYYFKTVANKKYFLKTDNFFNEFKIQYGLQGIDNQYLDRLEKKKRRILEMIYDDQLMELYFDYFARALIQHKNKLVKRDLGSFFTKLVHTFRPSDFCPLDNRVKKYFELDKESFYIASLIISHTYKEFAINNAQLIEQIRQEMKKIDNIARFPIDKMTDIKLFDLIFWYQAIIVRHEKQNSIVVQ